MNGGFRGLEMGPLAGLEAQSPVTARAGVGEGRGLLAPMQGLGWNPARSCHHLHVPTAGHLDEMGWWDPVPATHLSPLCTRRLSSPGPDAPRGPGPHDLHMHPVMRQQPQSGESVPTVPATLTVRDRPRAEAAGAGGRPGQTAANAPAHAGGCGLRRR